MSSYVVPTIQLVTKNWGATGVDYLWGLNNAPEPTPNPPAARTFPAMEPLSTPSTNFIIGTGIIISNGEVQNG